jgi:hypothetical protein
MWLWEVHSSHKLGPRAFVFQSYINQSIMAMDYSHDILECGLVQELQPADPDQLRRRS